MATATMTLTEACESGLWVPAYFGNRFKVVKLVGRYKHQHERPTIYRELADAQVECDRLNGCKTPRE